MKRTMRPQLEKNIEKSIIFLVEEYKKSGKNSKPVIFHSLSLAFYLLELGYNYKIIQAAVLHDLIEDSEVDLQKIQSFFGEDIARIVNSLTFNSNIEDKEEQYKELFLRVKKEGREALIIKGGDIYVNSFYIDLVNNEDKEEFLLKKLRYFLDISKEIISKERVWQDLKNRELEEQERIEKKYKTDR